MNSRDIEIIFSRLRKHLPIETEFVTKDYLETSKYSLAKFILGKGNRKRALISAGIHGDEPGGVETICSFLQNNRYKKFVDEWELTFLPCLNPYGYEHGTRENHAGKDLNRLFKLDSPPPEIEFVKSVFESPYELTLELHEDSATPGYYLYQVGTHDDFLGEKILQAVANIMPINLDEEIDGCSARGGLIVPQNDFKTMDWWPMALYSLSQGTQRCLTLETATRFPMDVRVEAHLLAVDTALNYFSGKK